MQLHVRIGDHRSDLPLKQSLLRFLRSICCPERADLKSDTLQIKKNEPKEANQSGIPSLDSEIQQRISYFLITFAWTPFWNWAREFESRNRLLIAIQSIAFYQKRSTNQITEILNTCSPFCTGGVLLTFSASIFLEVAFSFIAWKS